jgi:hypothetical protein
MAGFSGSSLLPVRHPAIWEFTRGTLFSARPRSLMAAILVSPAIRKPDVSHAVTVSTGIRMPQPGWNDMKPGIDGV